MATSRGDHLRLSAGEVVRNRYEVIEEIGCGNFSKVYRCYDRAKADAKERKRFPVAMKVLKKEYKNDATFERRMLKILHEKDKTQSLRVSKMIEYFEWHECPVFIMPIHGPSIRSRRLGFNRGCVTRPLLVEFAYDVLETLSFVHFTCKMVHTDLKPENILISDIAHTNDKSFGESWVICDFGSASLWRMEKLDSDLISTRPYRAPEVVLRSKWFYPADMWSVGCILYEVAVGHRLFEVRDDNTHLQLMDKRIGRLPDSFRRHARYSPRFFTAKGDFLIVAEAVRERRCRLTPLTEMFRDDPELLHLLQGLLTYDPLKRMTADQALAAPIFKEIRQRRGVEDDKVAWGEDVASLQEELPPGGTSPIYPQRRQDQPSVESLRLRAAQSTGETASLGVNTSEEHSGGDDQPARRYADPNHDRTNSVAVHSSASFSLSPAPLAIGAPAGATPPASSPNLLRPVSAHSHREGACDAVAAASPKGKATAAAANSQRPSPSLTATGGGGADRSRRGSSSSHYKTAKPNLASGAGGGGRLDSGSSNGGKPALRSLSSSGRPATTARSNKAAKVSRSSSAHSKRSAPTTPRGLGSTGPTRKSVGALSPGTPRDKTKATAASAEAGGAAAPAVAAAPGRGSSIASSSSTPATVVVKDSPLLTSGAGGFGAPRRAKGAVENNRGCCARSTAGSQAQPPPPRTASPAAAAATRGKLRPPSKDAASSRTPSKRPPSRTSSTASKGTAAAAVHPATIFQRQPTAPRGRASQPGSAKASRTSSVASLSAAPPLLSGHTAHHSLSSRGSGAAAGAKTAHGSSLHEPVTVSAAGGSDRCGRPASRGTHLERSTSLSSLRESLRQELSNAEGYKSPATPTRSSERRVGQSSLSATRSKSGNCGRIAPGRAGAGSPAEAHTGGAPRPNGAAAVGGQGEARSTKEPLPLPLLEQLSPPPQEHADALAKPREVREFHQSTVIDATDQAIANALSHTPRTVAASSAAAANRPLRPRMSLRVPVSSSAALDRRPPPAVQADKLGTPYPPGVCPTHTASPQHRQGTTTAGNRLAADGSASHARDPHAVVVPVLETRGETAAPTQLHLRLPSTPMEAVSTSGASSFPAGSPPPDDYSSPVRVREMDSQASPLESPGSWARAAGTPTNGVGSLGTSPSRSTTGGHTGPIVVRRVPSGRRVTPPTPAPATAAAATRPGKTKPRLSEESVKESRNDKSDAVATVQEDGNGRPSAGVKLNTVLHTKSRSPSQAGSPQAVAHTPPQQPPPGNRRANGAVPPTVVAQRSRPSAVSSLSSSGGPAGVATVAPPPQHQAPQERQSSAGSAWGQPSCVREGGTAGGPPPTPQGQTARPSQPPPPQPSSSGKTLTEPGHADKPTYNEAMTPRDGGERNASDSDGAGRREGEEPAPVPPLSTVGRDGNGRSGSVSFKEPPTLSGGVRPAVEARASPTPVNAKPAPVPRIGGRLDKYIVPAHGAGQRPGAAAVYATPRGASGDPSSVTTSGDRFERSPERLTAGGPTGSRRRTLAGGGVGGNTSSSQQGSTKATAPPVGLNFSSLSKENGLLKTPRATAGGHGGALYSPSPAHSASTTTTATITAGHHTSASNPCTSHNNNDKAEGGSLPSQNLQRDLSTSIGTNGSLDGLERRAHQRDSRTLRRVPNHTRTNTPSALNMSSSSIGRGNHLNSEMSSSCPQASSGAASPLPPPSMAELASSR